LWGGEEPSEVKGPRRKRATQYKKKTLTEELLKVMGHAQTSENLRKNKHMQPLRSAMETPCTMTANAK
jgi:hypothetical protein